MSESKKSETQPSQIPTPQPDAVTLLEAELAETLAAISGSFAEVRKFDESGARARDEFGNKRSAAVADAVKLLAVSAELGNAIAKVKGQYNHNINVLHGDIWPPPRRDVAKPSTIAEAVPSPETVAKAVADGRASAMGSPTGKK